MSMENPINCTPTKNDHSSKHNSFSSHSLTKRSFISSCFCLPITSLLALFLIILLAYNSFTIFFFFIPSFTLENAKGSHDNKLPSTSQLSSSSQRIYAIKDEAPHLFSYQSSGHYTQPKSPRPRKPKRLSKMATVEDQSRPFQKRVKEYFLENGCKVRVFMTWISSLESFGDRERFCIESLFKFNPNACLLIVSTSMDSINGTQILQPFLRMNFKVKAVSPDFQFLFKDTMAANWYDQLEKGNIKRGDISLGQNLSNLLRLTLLYKYGGIYMDTDFIILKRLSKLRNVIGAQAIDPKTKNWSRLNNAFLIFNKKHPLLSMFIEEFALTFDGNKWGHNGPYLVSRVVERLNGSMVETSNFTILPPPAFYMVDWLRIGSLFQQPKDVLHLQWVNKKLLEFEEKSYGLHLWNRQSRGIQIEHGSIISHLMNKACLFCNSSTATM